MSPRRVTVVANELRGFPPVGGMGTATTFLALALARLGHDVQILLGRHDPATVEPHWRTVFDDAGIALRAVPRVRERVEPWPFERPHAVQLALRDDPPDVVVAHDFGGPAASALRLRQAGLGFDDTLFVVFCHGSRRYVLDRSPTVAVTDLRAVLGVGLLEQASVELADVVVSPSGYLVGWMREHGWQLPERTLVIPYLSGSEATGEPPAVTPPPVGVPLERLTFFGRIDERKGLRLLASALNAVEPELLAGVELELLGRPTATWTRERVEALLSDRTTRALAAVSFQTELDQHDALARLARPGTLAVMPSLQENSPNTVYECLEHGIPFIASDVGGVPELVAPEERERVLVPATAEALEAALRRVLAERRIPDPVLPAFERGESLLRWAEVVELQPTQPTDAIARDDYVLVLDDDDVADPELETTLARALEAARADAATCGLRLPTDDGRGRLRFFYGDPGALGVLSNGYGTAALIRRSALPDLGEPPPGVHDRAWPLLAALAASGGRIVSVPAPLVETRRPPGSVHDDPVAALLALEHLERGLPEPVRGLARLVAGLEADSRSTPPPSDGGGMLDRARRLLLRRGPS